MRDSGLATGGRPQADGLRVARVLTVLIVPLAALAALAGLLVTGTYLDPPTLVPALRGQDLITVLALPVLVVSLARAARGSARAAQVWIGLLGYIFYTYAGAAVGYHFNRLLLVYVTLFSASLFGLVAAAIGLDVAALERRFDEGTPRGPVVAFLALIAVMLGALEIGQNIAYVTTGRVPPGVVNAGGMTFFPYALDLGIIVPLAVLASVWLWRRRPWGYPLAGFLLIKGATMGLALLAMNWFQWRSAQPTDGPLNAFYAFLALGGIALSAWFLRHCREEATQRF